MHLEKNENPVKSINSDVKFYFRPKMVVSMGIMSLTACMSGPKTKFSDPIDISVEEKKLERQISADLSDQSDVLAADEFAKTMSYLQKAQEGIKSGDKPKNIIENLEYASDHEAKTRELTAAREGQIPAILKARRAAINSGAQAFEESNKKLMINDQKVIDYSENLPKYITSEKSKAIETGYLDAQILAVNSQELGGVKLYLKQVDDEGGKKKLPTTYKTAEQDYNTASLQFPITSMRRITLSQVLSRPKEVLRFY